MKIKTITIIAGLTVLLCCKNETNIKSDSRLRATQTHKSMDTSKQEKVNMIKNNEYFLLNDKKIDQ